jgi:hypothetical protein
MANQKLVQPSSFGNELGLLYRRWTLDCVVTIAHAVSLDFSDRPELYQRINADTASRLTELQGSYGFQANFPDIQIRERLMKSIFGQSDGHGTGNDGSEFQTFRLPVLKAAAGFSENAQPITFPANREAVRNAIVSFRAHMTDLSGASLSQTDKRISHIFDVAQTILKDDNVACVFGINAKINQGWPLQSTDAQGANLIEKITTYFGALLPYGVIPRSMFVHMQRIAEKGFQSIRIILHETEAETIEKPEFDIDPLITELYAWGCELRLVGGSHLQQPAGMTTQTQPMAPMRPVSVAPAPMAPMPEATTRTTAYGR